VEGEITRYVRKESFMCLLAMKGINMSLRTSQEAEDRFSGPGGKVYDDPKSLSPLRGRGKVRG